MKFNFLIILLFLALNQSFFAQSTIFIKYKDFISSEQIENKINEKQFTNIASRNLLSLPEYKMNYLSNGLAKNIESLNKIVKIQFRESIDAINLIQLLQTDYEIEYAEVAKTYQINNLPNDSLVSQQWALDKIKVFDAWNITQGNPDIKLAVIDTGVDYFHTDLKNKIYYNQGEIGSDQQGKDKRFNGIDDDGNGFIDDYMGWDFTDRFGFPFDSSAGDYLDWDNNPFDDNGHGTYIAGIAAAQTNNISGIAGTAPNIKILNIRAFDPNGYGEEDDVAAAILYAVLMNARVINMSFGDDSFSLVLRDVIRFAHSQNMVMIASAGNKGISAPHYPSGYSEVICVGNSTINDVVAPSSNWGSTIDLVAPGTNILTTAKNNNYAPINGTSASAPFVSATACLILSRSNFSNEEVKQILKSTTDDIGESGWDLKSGAGRLNVFRALNVLAPSIVKFDFPLMDYSTFSDTLNVKATILSAYFQSFDLQFGVGFNPNSWTMLIENGLNQFDKRQIYSLNLKSLKDSTYTLRIIVKQNNGRTLEERVHFHINRTPPVAELISVLPCLYGNKNTILASVYTDEPSVVRLYFKPKNSPDNNFRFVTLDGFTINNQFVKQLHYGFVPVNLLAQNQEYDVYLEAENMVGLKTIIKNQSNFFNINLVERFQLSSYNYMDFELPAGNLYTNPLNILSSNNNEIILRESLNQKVSKIFTYKNNSFEYKDSLYERIVKDHGDFNNNGKLDLLTLFVRDGFILEQDNTFSSKFPQKFSKTGGDFWPIMARDIDADGRTEILVVKNDTTIGVWEIPNNQTLTPIEKTTIRNFSSKWIGQNRINSPNAIILDSNGDGVRELWLIDEDGDLFSFEIRGDNNFVPYKTISTEFFGNSAFLTNGDFNGDGKQEIAVLLHSIEKFDVAPYYRLIVFNFFENNINVLFDYPFIDAAYEFNNAFRKAENAIRFSDLDNDGKQELVLFTFPYAYVIKFYLDGSKFIAYFENVNSNSILISDFNKNDVKELALPKSDKIRFIEFLNSDKFSIPYITEAYSIDSTTVKLSWNGQSEKYLVYRGLTSDNLTPYKILNFNTLIDSGLNQNTKYYYSVQSIDEFNPARNSTISEVKEVLVQKETKVVKVTAKNPKNVVVTFNNKIRTTVDNLQAFKVINYGYPNSVTPLNSYSYLISFSSDLPLGNNQLVINSITDFYFAPIKSDTVNFIVSLVNEEEFLYVKNFKLLDPYNIKIEFSENLNSNSALNKENFIFQPNNSIKSINFESQTRNTLLINLTGGKPIGSVGIEYVLKMQNIFSDSLSGFKTLKEGAGSYIVFNKNLSNLSELYVYPNPVRVNSDNSNIVFANLTKRTKIQILNLSGKLIKELDTINESGGAKYDLRDENGSKINSGIYFFRISSIDDSGQETETKEGKFAVIR
mgnify:CR=1 FL=1